MTTLSDEELFKKIEVFRATRAHEDALTSNEIARLLALARRGAETKFKHTHTHRKGGRYHHLGTAKVQTTEPLKDMDHVEIYAAEDGSWWARNRTEFHDGRFTNALGTPEEP